MLRRAASAKSGWVGGGAAALLLSCVVGWYVLRVRELCRGELVYALDDPYIHLAIARQLVQHGTWGVSAHQFASASSSPAWTLLLAAATAVFGVHAEAAFVLAWLSGLLVCAGAAHALRASSERVRYLVPLAIVSLVPAHVLVLTGMEHLLQTALTLLLAASALDALEKKGTTRRGPRCWRRRWSRRASTACAWSPPLRAYLPRLAGSPGRVACSSQG